MAYEFKQTRENAVDSLMMEMNSYDRILDQFRKDFEKNPQRAFKNASGAMAAAAANEIITYAIKQLSLGLSAPETLAIIQKEGRDNIMSSLQSNYAQPSDAAMQRAIAEAWARVVGMGYSSGMGKYWDF